ncbi:hypothetical protein KR032_005355, partial [Drosophila birchii]
ATFGAILDSRCYLEGGGSAESFLATEDLAVGSIIGKLRINGDPTADTGDINLSLREKNAPVEIVAGTKELALSVELDKEGLRGPSSIYVNVICIRRHSTDPSFVVPVNVRVTDVNDNAPQWIGTPYTLTLSEVTVPGTRILQGARAEDADQPGPFSTVEYQVLPGPYSEFVQFLNPLEGTLVLKKALDYEQLQNFTVKLRAQDQGTPPRHSDTLLRVVITDADDQNPRFQRESYTAELPVDGRPGELRMRPEPLKAVDQDEGICAPIQYTIVQSQDAKYFRIHPHNGAISLLTPIGYADVANGATLVVKATQIDNPDRYALTTVQLTRPGSHSDLSTLAFVQKRFVMRIREDTAVGNRILALPTNKPGKHLKYTIPDPVNSQFFSVGSLGELVLAKPLDYEKMTKHEFQVMATDGMTNSTAELTLDVIDVNDWEPRFRETHYEFMVPKSVSILYDLQEIRFLSLHLFIPLQQSLQSRADSFEGVLIGKVEAADGDRNDKLELSLRGQHAGLFEIDATGNIFMRPEQLQSLNESTVHLIAIATDTGVPPRSTSVPVSVTMEGLTLAQSGWNSSMLGMFGMIVGLFLMIIVALSCYIVRSKKQGKSASSGLGLGRNRVHSQAHSSVSSANLVTHEKLAGNGNGNGASVTSGGVSVLHMKHGGNITMANPMNNGLHHVASGASSSMALGSSAALLERERERERDRERQRESYAATVRIFLPGIVSRASANGQLFEEEDEIEHDSLQTENNNRKVAAGTGNGVTTITTTSANANGSNLLSATDAMGSSENNLTVYF